MHGRKTRYGDTYISRANTDWFMKSPIIQVQKLPNEL